MSSFYSQGYVDALSRLGIQKNAGYWQNVVGMSDPTKLEALRKQYLAAESGQGDYTKQEEDAAAKALGKQPSYPETKELPGSRLKRSLVGAGIGSGVGGLMGLAAMLQGGKPSLRDLPFLGGAMGIGGVGGGLLGALSNGSQRRQDPREKKTYDEYWKKRNTWSDQYRKDNPDTSPTLDPPEPGMFGGKNLGYLGKYVSVPGMVGFSGEEPLSGSPTGKGYLSREELLNELQGLPSEGLDPAGMKQMDLLKAIQESPYSHFTSTEAG